MQRWILVVMLACTARAEAPQPPSTEEILVTDPTTAKFSPITTSGFAPGAQAAPIGVDPNTKGATGYAKFPPKYQVAPHWHSYAEYVTVVKGPATLTLDGKRYEMVAGSYAVIPAKAKHELVCGASECLVISRRAGPVDYNWVK
jgi:quercetin dioxygenase-like cupin family protein